VAAKTAAGPRRWRGWLLGYELTPGMIHFGHKSGRGFASMGLRPACRFGRRLPRCERGQRCSGFAFRRRRGVGILLGMGAPSPSTPPSGFTTTSKKPNPHGLAAHAAGQRDTGGQRGSASAAQHLIDVVAGGGLRQPATG